MFLVAFSKVKQKSEVALHRPQMKGEKVILKNQGCSKNTKT